MAQDAEKETKPTPGEVQTDEFPETHLEREDDRWSLADQTRDWLVLLLMIAIYFFWAGIIYFFEPGIR
jgi:hypothetical protein